MDFVRVAKTLADFFHEKRYPFAVVGAFGLSAYGMIRATQDLDFITSTDAQDELVEFLESLGYETIHRSEGYSNHVHTNMALGRVDIIYVAGETKNRLFLETAVLLQLGDLSLPVPRAEHLAGMKIHAMKNDPGRTFQEMADIQFLLGIPGIDEAAIRSYFEKSGLLERYDEIKKVR